MSAIVTVTLNPALDKSSSIDHVVADRKLRCHAPSFDPGGGGINVARAIHELGGQSTAYWMCGGPMGQLLKELLDDEGIDHRPIPIEDFTRENLVIHEESTGQQFRFGFPGATLTDAEVRRCIDQLEQIDPSPDYLVLSGSLPPGVSEDLYARIAEAMSGSSKVILDTSGTPLRRGLEQALHLIKPNINELGQLAGREIKDDQAIHDVARSIIEAGKAEVILTSIGRGGAFLTTASEHVHVRAPTVEIRSRIGAGDSTLAGLVLALSRGKKIADAARFGVAAGAAAVMTEGTRLCRRADVERLYQEMIREQLTSE
jgi:6-phosphofructokinase 2